VYHYLPPAVTHLPATVTTCIAVQYRAGTACRILWIHRYTTGSGTTRRHAVTLFTTATPFYGEHLHFLPEFTHYALPHSRRVRYHYLFAFTFHLLFSALLVCRFCTCCATAACLRFTTCWSTTFRTCAPHYYRVHCITLWSACTVGYHHLLFFCCLIHFITTPPFLPTVILDTVVTHLP